MSEWSKGVDVARAVLNAKNVDFNVRNVGTAPLHGLTATFVATPHTVQLANADERRLPRDDAPWIMAAGPFEAPIPPDPSRASLPFGFDVRIGVPQDVEEFDVEATVWGSETALPPTKVHFRVRE